MLSEKTRRFRTSTYCRINVAARSTSPPASSGSITIGTIASALQRTPDARSIVKARNTRDPVPPIPKMYNFDIFFIFFILKILKKEYADKHCFPI